MVTLTVAHVVVGALTLAGTVVVAVVSHRFAWRRRLLSRSVARMRPRRRNEHGTHDSALQNLARDALSGAHQARCFVSRRDDDAGRLLLRFPRAAGLAAHGAYRFWHHTCCRGHLRVSIISSNAARTPTCAARPRARCPPANFGHAMPRFWRDACRIGGVYLGWRVASLLGMCSRQQAISRYTPR